MPFVQGGTRNEQQLTSFFENNLKRPIENATLINPYQVYRSGQAFDITTEIIRDLCRADIVIADLSGTDPNPNVMYELGVRLASSDKPVILIREALPHNRRIFDIYGFYTYEYDPYSYRNLEDHIIDKLRRLETGEEVYSNPVLALVRIEASKANPDLTNLSPNTQRSLALRGVRAVAANVTRAYGPSGLGLAIDTPTGDTFLERRGSDIARSIRSANPYEERGIRLIARTAINVGSAVGDGTKLPVILTDSLVDSGLNVSAHGGSLRAFLDGLTAASVAAVDAVRQSSRHDPGLLPLVAKTAAKTPPVQLDLAAITEAAGANDALEIEEVDGDGLTVVHTEGFVIERGPVRPDFLATCSNRRCTLTDCFVLVTPVRISSMAELLPVLEEVAQMKRSLLLISGDVEGEALATLHVNFTRGTLRCIPIRAPSGERGLDILADIAAATGATLLSPALGYSLQGARVSELGQANKAIVGATRTEISGGGGKVADISERVASLRALLADAQEADAPSLRRRIALLAGKITTIRVGGRGPQQRRDRMYQIESAVHALLAASRSGSVLGSGMALVSASRSLPDVAAAAPDYRAGVEALRAALLVPQALLNSEGLTPGPVGDRTGTEASGAAIRIDSGAATGLWDPAEAVVRGIESAVEATRSFLETGAWHVSTSG